MIDAVARGLDEVMRAVHELGNAEDAAPEVALASGYAWAKLREEKARLEKAVRDGEGSDVQP